MSLVSVSEVAFQYTSGIPLFAGVTFSINPNDRIGVVGSNGAGKSTLLQLLCGRLTPTHGAIAIRRNLTISTAQQEVMDEADRTLFEFVFEARPTLASLRRQIHGLETNSLDPSSAIFYAHRVAEYEEIEGYAAEAATKRTLCSLGFRESELDIPLSRLSGGQRTRASIARALSSTADLLLLDEPTNHLDIYAREWLERELSSRNGACVIASHDRSLLRSFAKRILEVERGAVTVFEGGYDEYRSRRLLLLRQAWADYHAFQRRKTAAEEAAEGRSRLAARVVIAPAGERHGKDHFARKAAKVSRTARILRERQTHEPKVEKPWEEQPIGNLSFDRVPRSGDIPVMAINLTKSYGSRHLFSNVSFQLRRGERMAILGPNGVGKTTLLNILIGTNHPDSGEVRFGVNVRAEWFSQDAVRLNLDQSPLEICGSDTHARTLLGSLKVRPDCVNRPVRELSGGERTKVILASLLASTANLLLLDEPTNHLEIEAQEALEEALVAYPGTLIVVSHDRAFLDALGPELKLLHLDGIASVYTKHAGAGPIRP